MDQIKIIDSNETLRLKVIEIIDWINKHEIQSEKITPKQTVGTSVGQNPYAGGQSDQIPLGTIEFHPSSESMVLVKDFQGWNGVLRKNLKSYFDDRLEEFEKAGVNIPDLKPWLGEV